VVDHQIDGGQRVDLFRIAAELAHGIAHRRKIDDRRDAGEILHQHARRAEGDLALRRALAFQPLRHGKDVVARHRAVVLVAQQVLEQHLERHRQGRYALKAVFLRRLEAVVLVALVSHSQSAPALEAVEGLHGHHRSGPSWSNGSRRLARTRPKTWLPDVMARVLVAFADHH
jgi:hypothetical protein